MGGVYRPTGGRGVSPGAFPTGASGGGVGGGAPSIGGGGQALIRSDGQGNVWISQDNGSTWALAPFQERVPGSGGSSYNVSDIGPNIQAQNAAELAFKQQELELKQREHEQQMRNDAVAAKYTQDKLKWEIESGNKADARATQALQEQIASRQAATQLSYAGLLQDARQNQAAMEFQAAQANARAQAEANQINEQRQTANLEQRRAVANDIAGFARNPGDVGANASYLLAGGATPAGTGSLSTAMAQGADARTPQALVPLDLLLANRAELAKGPQLFTPSLISPPRVQMPGMPDFNAIQTAQARASSMNPMFANGAPVIASGPGATFGAQKPGGGNVLNYGDSAVPLGTQYSDPNTGVNAHVDSGGNLVGFSMGGVTREKMFLGDEKGAELYFNPTGAPLTVVPAPFVKAMGITKPSGKSKGTIPGYANGTTDPFFQVAAGQIPDVPTNNYLSDTTSSAPDINSLYYGGNEPSQINSGASKDFLNQALGIARRGTPFATGQLPTPVGVSAPGTNPFIQSLASSLAALGHGINPGLFLNEAAAAAPVGLSGAPMRRTR